MKFKHAFHVFVDNFSTVYKLLLFRVIVDAVGLIIGALILSPLIASFLPEVNNVIESAINYALRLLSGEIGDLREFSQKVVAAFNDLVALFNTKKGNIVIVTIILCLIFIVQNWVKSFGNFAAASAINDKMAFHADSHFVATIINNLKPAALYGLIYVPLSLLYDAVSGFLFFFLFFNLLPASLPFFFVNLFLFILCMVFSTSVKMTFTTDWLPAIIRGRKKPGEAMVYTLSRTNKKTLNIFSNFAVMIILILGVNVFAIFCTIGVGLIITVPASYIILLSFEFVNYYDREEMKYFIDKNTIIKPVKEHTLTRQEFLRGDTDR